MGLIEDSSVKRKEGRKNASFKFSLSRECLDIPLGRKVERTADSEGDE